MATQTPKEDLRTQISRTRLKAKEVKRRRERSETSSTDSSSKEASTKNDKVQSRHLVAAPTVPDNPIDINDLTKALKKLEDEEDDDEDLLEGSDSPFIADILKARLPKRMKVNFTLKYDGTTNLRAYIRDFVSFMALDQVSSRATCNILLSASRGTRMFGLRSWLQGRYYHGDN